MTTSSDFNMLWLEVPQELLKITNGTAVPDQAIEMANPAVWVQTIVRQQRQAENDLKQLANLCNNTID